jgi:hypothetical protein
MKLSLMAVALALIPNIALAGGIAGGCGPYGYKGPDCSECSRVYVEQSRGCMTTVCMRKASQIAGNCRLICCNYDWRSAWWGNADP